VTNVELVVRGVAVGDWTNAVSVMGLEGDPDVGNNEASWESRVVPAVDLGLSLGDGGGVVFLGQENVQTFTVTNDGPSEATGVTVEGQLGEGLELVSWSEGASVATNGVGEWLWTVGTVTQGQTVTLEMTVRGRLTGSWSNRVSVQAAEVDPAPDNNVGVIVEQVKRFADLQLLEGARPTVVLYGRPFTFEVILTNAGPNDLTSVTVRDVWPEGAQIAGVTAQEGACVVESGQVIWSLAVLDAGSSRWLRVSVIPNSLGVLTNRSELEADLVDPNETDNVLQTAVEVLPIATLALALVDAPDPIMVNDRLTYTMTVTNQSPYLVPDVTLVDDLPVGVEVTGWTTTQGAVTRNGETLIFNLGNLASGAEATMTLLVKPNVVGAITNAARIASAYADPLDPRLAALSVTQVVPNPPLTVHLAENRVRVSWPSVALGYQLQYRLSIGTQGTWLNDPNVPREVDGHWVVELKPVDVARFYRLFKTSP
jgi:uncharacterized repeat protein (TIGR01451 family)